MDENGKVNNSIQIRVEISMIDNHLMNLKNAYNVCRKEYANVGSVIIGSIIIEHILKFLNEDKIINSSIENNGVIYDTAKSEDKIHNFVGLYKKIPQEKKDTAEELYKSLSYYNDIKDKYTNFQSVIQKAKNAFVNARYAAEYLDNNEYLGSSCVQEIAIIEHVLWSIWQEAEGNF